MGINCTLVRAGAGLGSALLARFPLLMAVDARP